MRILLTALLLLASCASVPLPQAQRFTVAAEVTRTSRALGATIEALTADDSALTGVEREAAAIARVATLLALGSYLYHAMAIEDRRLVDMLAKVILEHVYGEKKRSSEQHTSWSP